jgi:membrane-bound lytic murein transglycosylase D
MAQIPIEVAVEKASANKFTAISHKIKQGDTLSKLAKRYGVSSKQIMQQNHLKSKNLTVGQTLQFEQQESTASSSGKKSSSTHGSKGSANKSSSASSHHPKKTSSSARKTSTKASTSTTKKSKTSHK